MSLSALIPQLAKPISNADIDLAWNRLRHYAILHLLRNCFAAQFSDEELNRLEELRHDPTIAQKVDPLHRHCWEFWLTVPTEQFFCLGAVNTCVNCGYEWVGAVNYDPATGELVKGVCPNCHEPFDAEVLQRDTWRMNLHHTLLGMMDQISQQMNRVVSHWFFLIAAEMVANAKQPDTFLGFQSLQTGILNTFAAAGIVGRTDAYDAVRWHVWRPAAIRFLNLPEGFDVGRTVNWKRHRAGLIQKAGQAFFANIQPPSAHLIAQALKDDQAVAWAIEAIEDTMEQRHRDRLGLKPADQDLVPRPTDAKIAEMQRPVMVKVSNKGILIVANDDLLQQIQATLQQFDCAEVEDGHLATGIAHFIDRLRRSQNLTIGRETTS